MTLQLFRGDASHYSPSLLEHSFLDSYLGPPGSCGTPCKSQGLCSLKGASAFLFFSARLVQGHVRLVYRPVLAPQCEGEAPKCASLGAKGPVRLGGYGVELALKNVEYKAHDDSKVANGTWVSCHHNVSPDACTGMTSRT